MKKVFIILLFMFLLVKSGDPTLNRVIHDASNINKWDPAKHFDFTVVVVPGNANTFAWPNDSASAAVLTPSNQIIRNPEIAVTPNRGDLRDATIDATRNLGELKEVLKTIFRGKQ